MKIVQYKPIGIINSPFKEPKGMPIQPVRAKGVSGTVELQPEYKEGLKDLEGFSHIMLIYHFHLSEGYSLKVKPFLDDTLRGLFATRAPKRPNPIGVSVVRLEKIEGTTLYISNVDIVDGTPLLDIKPYVPEFDKSEEKVRIGWLSKKIKKSTNKRSDESFRS
ncbi:MAG: tRNA (N6-threonylcarbamoyladenosine(37)-N6)-methyltransferase TrmO [Candidatus Wukongarchaeota archaeon]|nr:tRNA (N6-threonylcarbamoyladenosine(37)-N6)-methyltransferase TrmO [Candidatus Wukongarchaeota archaeon]